MSIEQQAFPPFFMIVPLLFIILGATFLRWGGSMPGKGLWVLFPAILILLILLGFDSGVFTSQAWLTRVWAAGWIWDKHELGAMTLSFYQDRIAIFMVFAVVLTALPVLMNKSILLLEPYPERVVSGFAFSLAGVAIAWISGTPWLCFLGLFLVILGAFIAMGSRWEKDLQADLSIRFVFERCFGLVIAILGALVLSSLHAGVSLHGQELWLNTEAHISSLRLGLGLLFLGLYIQMQPFPLLRWLFLDSDLSTPFRVFLCQVAPAWAALSILVRFYNAWVHVGLFPSLGWLALVSCILTFISGLFQKGWKQSLNAWIAGGLSLSIGVLAFSGVFEAIALFLGIVWTGLIFSIFYSAQLRDGKDHEVQKKKASVLKVFLFLAGASGTGFIGFISMRGAFFWLYQVSGYSLEFTACLLTLLFSGLLVWKITWGMSCLKEEALVPWSVYGSISFLLLFSVAFLWTGSFSGGFLGRHLDQIFPSIFEFVFEASNSRFDNGFDDWVVISLYFGVFLVGFVASYWMVARKENQWQVLSGLFPRISSFIQGGYGVDSIITYLRDLMRASGSWFEAILDKKFWNEWVPQTLLVCIKAISEISSQSDQKLMRGLNYIGRQSIEIPAKFLQILQTGDLRWYLFLTLSAGFGMLTHFLMR